MTTERGHRDIADWLAAEAEGRLEEADALFGRPFSTRVPRLRPAPGLDDRVLAALAFRPVGVPLRGVPAWGRWAAVALLFFGGLAAAAFWSTWWFDLVRVSWTLAPRAARVGASLSGAWLDTLAHTWTVAASVGRALSMAVASGPGLAVLVGNLMLALLAAFGLRRVLSLEEESS